jgi:23S rRNA (pseudouridine1915-N3)-methyltransferase
LLWSLSKLTFTHELARLLLFEQLFRAENILNGGHYHRP